MSISLPEAGGSGYVDASVTTQCHMPRMWKAAVHQRGTATVVVPWQRLLGVALTPPHRQVCLVFKRVYLVNSTASGVRR